MNISSIKTESGCCYDDDTVVDHPPSVNEDDASSSSIIDGIIDETNLFELPLEQTYKLSYPVGCPVWYNKTLDVYYCGVVKAVLMDFMSRKIYYRVEKTKNGIDHSPHAPENGEEYSTQDLIQEDKVVYAAKCPVLVGTKSDSGDTKDNKGEIVCPRGKNKANTIYTVMVFMEDNKVRVEDGVVSQRIKFRSSTYSEKESATITQEKEVQVVGGPSAASSTHRTNKNNTMASSNNKDSDMDAMIHESNHISKNNDDKKKKQLQRIVSSDSSASDAMMGEEHSSSATDQRWVPPPKKRCANSISVGKAGDEQSTTRIPKKQARLSTRPKPKGTLQKASTETSPPVSRNSGVLDRPRPNGCRCLFVGNLSKRIDENAIRDLLSWAGVMIKRLQRDHRYDGSKLP